jgi:ParB/RepB/Spo0J family partition protein
MMEQEALGDGLVIKDRSEILGKFEDLDERTLNFDKETLEVLDRVENFKAEETKPRPLLAAMVPVSFVVPKPNQPRQVFDEEELEEMAETIRARGRVTHAVIVTPCNGKLVLISGERRWRATLKAKVPMIPVEIELDAGSDLDIFEKSLVANFHQKRMSLAEEAYAMKKLMTGRGWTRAQLARRMGKTVSDISNLFKLFNLHEEFQAMLLSSKIKPGAILQLAIFETEAQMPLWEDLNEEVAAKFNGKMPHPNIVAKILRRLAEARGIVPRKKKRGGQAGSHAEMVIRSLRRTMKKLREGIEEFSGLSDEALKLVGDSEVFNVLTNLGQIAELIEDECHHLKTRLHI